MGRMARLVLSRISPLLWVAAVVSAALLAADPRWSTPIARGLVGIIIVVTGGAIGGTVCGAIEATHNRSMSLLLGVILDETPTREPDQKRLRAAG